MKTTGIISLCMSVLALLNFVLNAAGLPSLQLDDQTVTGLVNGVVAVVGVLGCAWTNFNLTTPAKMAQNIKDGLKNGTIDVEKAGELLGNVIQEGRHFKNE